MDGCRSCTGNTVFHGQQGKWLCAPKGAGFLSSTHRTRLRASSRLAAPQWIEPDDVVLLCSDGFVNHVHNEQIGHIALQQTNLDLPCEQLMVLARQCANHHIPLCDAENKAIGSMEQASRSP